MKEQNWREERILNQCWELLEHCFYEQWVHGTLWCLVGLIGLAVALIPDHGWLFVSTRLTLAAIVLGFGLSFIKALSLQQMVQKSPKAFVSIFAGKRCNISGVKRYKVFLGLMEGGFVLVECLVLFGLLGLSTTVATVPVKGTGKWLLAAVLWVYGFFALAFGIRNMATALAWSYWLRSKLEYSLNWQGANWLLASGQWMLTRFNLLRPKVKPRLNDHRFPSVWQVLLLCLILMVMIFALTLAALTLS